MKTQEQHLTKLASELCALVDSGASLSGPSDGDKAILRLLQLDQLDEATVLSMVMRDCEQDTGDFLQRLMCLVEIQGSPKQRSRFTRMVAIPVLMPARPIRRWLSNAEKLQELEQLAMKMNLLPEDASVRFSPELVHVDELYTRSYSDLYRVSKGFHKQCRATELTQVQISPSFWSETPPKLYNWDVAFQAELYFILGAVSGTSRVIHDELPGSLGPRDVMQLQGGALQPTEALRVWSKSVSGLVGEGLLSTRYPHGAGPMQTLYSSVQTGLELGRRFHFATKLLDYAKQHGITTKELEAEVCSLRGQSGVGLAGCIIRVSKPGTPAVPELWLHWSSFAHEVGGEPVDAAYNECVRMGVKPVSVPTQGRDYPIQ